MADEHGPYIDAEGPDTDLVLRGCCIRLYPTGPEIHANTAHISTGIESVHIGPDDGWLWIVHNGSMPVVAILPSPDETITSRGIIAGGSGGTNYSRIRFTENTPTGPVPLDLREPVDYARVAGPSSNLWYTVVQIRTRTQGLAGLADRMWTHHQALAARVTLVEQNTPLPLLGQVTALIGAVEAGLCALESGPVT